MSLQRIFESARKLGLPVIVTDLSGRDPMVVLPLEQFEAMAGAGEAREPEPLISSQLTKPVTEPEVAVISQVPVISEVAPVVSPQMTHFSSEISLEEGFYIDSVSDQEVI